MIWPYFSSLINLYLLPVGYISGHKITNTSIKHHYNARLVLSDFRCHNYDINMLIYGRGIKIFTNLSIFLWFSLYAWSSVADLPPYACFLTILVSIVRFCALAQAFAWSCLCTMPIYSIYHLFPSNHAICYSYWRYSISIRLSDQQFSQHLFS